MEEQQRFSYGDLIRDAFWISWRNKFLWFFGFFAAGAASNYSSNISNTSPETFQNLPSWLQSNLVAILVTVAVVALILFILFIFLAVVSTGGLSESVAAINRGEERRFGTTWRAGLSVFWGVLFQAILYFLIGVGLFILISVIAGLPILLTFLLTQATAARIIVAVIFGILGVLALIALFIGYGIVGQYSIRALVIDGAGIAGGIRRGYGVFRRNFGRSLLVWLINLGLSIAVGIVSFVAVLLFGLVLALPAILFGVSQMTTATVAAGIVGAVILLPILILLTAATGTYFHAYWTLAYVRISGGAPGVTSLTSPRPTDPAPPTTTQQP